MSRGRGFNKQLVLTTLTPPLLSNPLNSMTTYLVEVDRIELSYKTYTAPSAQENF